ncbi:MAG TPA: malate/lactate/ureidoglycolate dehydrogenase [Casimicrobiaceae bacterium]|nr:malate/lactate/ureidoglycolate dehydrogenase [Casimicrobiaceae bacterium]
MSRSISTPRIPATTLADFGERMFIALGCTAAEAKQIADNLVQANLVGHDSHGIGLLPQYVDNVRGGHALPGQRATLVVDAGSLLSLDGGKGFGQVIGEAAMDLAIERARAHGCAVVGLSNTHHLGRIGHWGEQCASAGFVSVHFVNVLSRPLVAPWGGTDARVSTNPFCVAVPHSPHPLVLDYATSAVALGKTRVAMEKREAMADGMLLDEHGQPTNDPSVMWRENRGAILSFAQHKGWALSTMCEILGGALSGGHVQTGRDFHPMLNNMLTLVFDPARLGTADLLDEEIARLAAWVKASPRMPTSDSILFPGEPERRTAAIRSKDGIPMPLGTLAALAKAGDSLQVDVPWKEHL